MASDGWQGQKDSQTSKWPHMAMNLYISNLVHVSGKITFNATVRNIVTQGNLYCNGVVTGLTGASGTLTRNMNPVSAGQYVDFGTYSCEISVADSATSANVTATMTTTCTSSSGGTIGGSASWTLSFDQYTPPTPTATPKLYGSVNGRARKIGKLYCSVNNQTRKIKKLYAGDAGGNAKLIYEDNS